MAELNTTKTSSYAWSPDIVTLAPEDAIDDALIMKITTKGAEIEGDAVAVRVPVVVDDEAHLVPEGAEIPTADQELAERVLMTVKIAKIMKISREQLEQDNAETILAEAAARSMIAKADAVLLNQPKPEAPAVIPPAGILNQDITDAGTLGANLDVLVDALSTVRTNGARPTNWVLAPTTWSAIQKLKVATGSAQTLLGAGTADTQPLLLGVPVIVNAQMPTKTGLLLDSHDIVSAYGGLRFAQSEAPYFTSDNIAIRLTWRIGATVVHKNRHAKFATA